MAPHLHILIVPILVSFFCTVNGEDYSSTALRRLNAYRALHGSPPLVWSNELQAEAQKLALKFISNNLPLAPAQNLKWGQSLYEGSHYGPSDETKDVEAAIELWYQDISNYDWSNQRSSKLYSFTQIIWKDTKRVGLGIAQNDQRTVIFALYDPSGNVRGQYAENVLQKGSPSESEESGCGSDIDTWTKSCCEQEQRLMQAEIDKEEAKGFVLGGTGFYYFRDHEATKKCRFQYNPETSVGASISRPGFDRTTCNSYNEFCTWQNGYCDCDRFAKVGQKQIRGRTYTLLKPKPVGLW